ncbi:MAG: 50S ribosomal protein L25 [Nitrospinae bacterium]|nr:50S ribosomal protein L25 [Nitrospinota bacterium]
MRGIRRNGFVPGVIYGKDKSVSITVNAKELETLMKKSRNQLLTLDLIEDGKTVAGKMVLIKEIQRHPLKDNLIHVDFFEVAMDKKQKIKVRLNFIGVPKGVKLGGVCNYVRRDLEVECLPGDIPEVIDLDISGLDAGQSIHLRDLELKEGVKILGNPMDVLVAVVKAEVEKAAPAAAAEGTEAAGEKAPEAAAKA